MQFQANLDIWGRSVAKFVENYKERKNNKA